MKHLLLITICAALIGCSSGPKVKHYSTVPEPINELIVLDGAGRYGSELRDGLLSVGFKVKATPFVAITTQPTEKEATTEQGSETWLKAGSRFAVRPYPGGISNWCMYGNAVQFSDYRLELVDLRENEILLTVSQGGWTSDCGWHSGKLFPDLGRLLREATRGQDSPQSKD